MNDLSIVSIEKSGGADRSIQKVITRMFPETRYVKFLNTDEAYSFILKQTTYQIVFCNIESEGTNSIKIFKRIKENKKPNDIYYIMTNATGNKELNLLALKAGIDDIIDLPASIDRYISCLKTAVKIINLSHNVQTNNLSIKSMVKKLDEDSQRELKLIKMFQKSKLPDFYIYLKPILSSVKFILKHMEDVSDLKAERILKATEYCFVGRLKLPGAIKYSPIMDKGLARGPEFEETASVAKNLFQEIHGAEDIGEMLFQLHENWDGSGFPAKLQAHQINIGARIIRVVVDYFELFIKYKEKESKALDEIYEYSRKLYDFEIVAWMDQSLAHKNSTIEKPIETIARLKELAPGMTVSRRIVSKSGNILIGAGIRLDQEKIDKLMEMVPGDPIIGNIYIKVK